MIAQGTENTAEIEKGDETVALAIGGLAGSNAFGAGCLQAAINKSLQPKLISCTTGQIFWVYSYLKARKPNERDIRARFKEYHQAEAPVFNFAHGLYRMLWHGPQTRLLWALTNGTDAEKNAKKWSRSALVDMCIPANTILFRGIAPYFQGWPAYMLMHERDWIQVVKTLFGVPDRYHMPLPHMAAESFKNLVDAIYHLVSSTDERVYMMRELGDLIPGHLLEPVFLKDDAWVGKIYEEFENTDDIGILFNSYEPRTGCEHVYLNPKAREMLPDIKMGAKATGSVIPEYQDRVIYEELAPEAVRDALWLWYYSFDRTRDDVCVDGAYFREVILSELQEADTIYVARPISHRWIGEFPRTYTEIRDMETEVLFNGAYQGERDRILMVNKFLADNQLHGGKTNKFRIIDLVEVSIDQQRGFFDVLFEDEEVFDDAVKRFEKVFH